MDKLGIVWGIHEQQVNNLGNVLPMLAPYMLPAPNNVLNHIFSPFNLKLFSHNSLYTSARPPMSVEMMT